MLSLILKRCHFTNTSIRQIQMLCLGKECHLFNARLQMISYIYIYNHHNIYYLYLHIHLWNTCIIINWHINQGDPN